jgi:hypothetical protein
MFKKILLKIKSAFSKIALFSTITAVVATVYLQDTNTKIKTYFCKRFNQVTYFDYNPPSHSWGKCYYTFNFTKNEYANQKSKILIDSRIYRNFIIQYKLVNVNDPIPLKQ